MSHYEVARCWRAEKMFLVSLFFGAIWWMIATFLFLLLCHVNIRSCSNLTRVFNVGGLEKIHVNINGDKRRLLYMLITTCFLSLVALLLLPSYSFHFQTAFMNIVVTFQTRSFSFYSCYQTYSKSTVVGGRGNLDRKYSLSG